MFRARRTGIRQRDTSDCGPACITSVMAHYGKRVPVSRVRQAARTDQQGTSILGMVEALEKFSFEARGLKGSAEHLDQLPCPFIAHMVQPGGIHHYVAVFGIRGKSFRIMDPSEGKVKRWSRQAFRDQWSGSVIAMVPGATQYQSGWC